MNTIKLTRPASLEMTRPAALALLVIADRGPEFAQGVLWALGLIDLANALAHYRTRMDAAMRDIRASLGQPETPASISATVAASAAAEAAAAGLDDAWDQVELLRVDAERYLAAHHGHVEDPS